MKKYPCSLCTYEATAQGSLTQHKKSIHQGVKYPCTICAYKASCTSDLSKHIKSQHKQIEKYQCDVILVTKNTHLE